MYKGTNLDGGHLHDTNGTYIVNLSIIPLLALNDDHISPLIAPCSCNISTCFVARLSSRTTGHTRSDWVY